MTRSPTSAVNNRVRQSPLSALSVSYCQRQLVSRGSMAFRNALIAALALAMCLLAQQGRAAGKFCSVAVRALRGWGPGFDWRKLCFAVGRTLLQLGGDSQGASNLLDNCSGKSRVGFLRWVLTVCLGLCSLDWLQMCLQAIRQSNYWTSSQACSEAGLVVVSWGVGKCVAVKWTTESDCQLSDIVRPSRGQQLWPLRAGSTTPPQQLLTDSQPNNCNFNGGGAPNKPAPNKPAPNKVAPNGTQPPPVVAAMHFQVFWAQEDVAICFTKYTSLALQDTSLCRSQAAAVQQDLCWSPVPWDGNQCQTKWVEHDCWPSHPGMIPNLSPLQSSAFKHELFKCWLVCITCNCLYSGNTIHYDMQAMPFWDNYVHADNCELLRQQHWWSLHSHGRADLQHSGWSFPPVVNLRLDNHYWVGTLVRKAIGQASLGKTKAHAHVCRQFFQALMHFHVPRLMYVHGGLYVMQVL